MCTKSEDKRNLRKMYLCVQRKIKGKSVHTKSEEKKR